MAETASGEAASSDLSAGDGKEGECDEGVEEAEKDGESVREGKKEEGVREGGREEAEKGGAKEEKAGKSETGRRRFTLREELAEVKAIFESQTAGEDKSTLMHKKYHLLARDHKRLERRLVECQRKQLEVAQHRDVVQSEYARVSLAKSKLESLCRELQKHNRAVVEESKQRAREEEEKRREVSVKFQSTINEITVKMQEHHQRNQTLREENADLVGKLKMLAEQYDAREEEFERVLKQKQLELQLCEIKMTQQTVAAAEAKETSMAERQYLLSETLEQQQRCEQLASQEAELRGQLSMYSEKFEEFQSTLTRSNEVFTTFKKEMDRMSKTISTLQKETVMWKSRYEKCNRSLLEMAEERLSHEETVAGLRGKCERLERLCRALQGERSDLTRQLKEKESVSHSNSTAEGEKEGEGGDDGGGGAEEGRGGGVEEGRGGGTEEGGGRGVEEGGGGEERVLEGEVSVSEGAGESLAPKESNERCRSAGEGGSEGEKDSSDSTHS